MTEVSNKPAARRSRPLRTLAWLLGGLVVVAVGIAAMLAVSPPSWLVKDALVSAVERETGRKLTIAGATTLRVIPSPSLRLEKVTLADPAGAPGSAPAAADLVEADIVVDNLFQRRFHVPRLVLTKPSLSVSDDDPLMGGKGGGQGLVLGDTVRNVVVKDGTLVYVPKGAAPIKIEDINVQATRRDGSTGLSGSAKVEGEKVTFDGALGAAGAAGTPVKLTVDARPLKATVDAAFKTAPARAIEGEMKAETGSLHDLLRWLGFERVEEMQLPAGAATISGKFKADPAVVEIDQGTYALAAIGEGTGRIALAIAGPRTKVDAKLAFKTLNLDAATRPAAVRIGAAPTTRALGAAVSATAELPPVPSLWESLSAELDQLTAAQARGVAVAAAPPAKELWSAEPLKIDGLVGHDFDLDLAVTAQAMTYGRLAFKAGDVVVKAREDGLDVAIASLGVGNGTAKGTIRIDARAAELRSTVKLTLDRAAMDQLLVEAVPQGLLVGAGTGTIDLAASGESPRRLVTSLDGAVKLTVENGAIIGYDLGQILRTLGRKKDYDPKARTRFSRLTANYAVKQGTLRSQEDLKLLGEDADLSARGSLALPTQRVDQAGRVVSGLLPFGVPVNYRLSGLPGAIKFNWSIFSSLSERGVVANPFDVATSLDPMPADLRAKIERALDADPATSPLTPDMRDFLKELLAKH